METVLYYACVLVLLGFVVMFGVFIFKNLQAGQVPKKKKKNKKDKKG